MAQTDTGRASALPLGSPDWQQVLAQTYAPVAYTPSFVLYQQAYFGAEDASRIYYNDNQPVAVWPLAVREGRITSNGGPILPPLMVDGLQERVQKRIVSECLRELDETMSALGQAEVETSEVNKEGFSLWQRRVREAGGKFAVPGVEMFIDLGWEPERIHSNIRKSYRSLIRQGQKEYSTILGVNILPLQRLHAEVAGRVTRGEETWQAQQSAVEVGEAFLVYVLDKADEVVGGALFHRSDDEGLYAVGVYRRDLHDQPLGHLVQAFAIEHMQNLGLSWYYLGLRPYEGVSDKELQIAHFKEGWATHFFPRIATTIRLK